MYAWKTEEFITFICITGLIGLTSAFKGSKRDERGESRFVCVCAQRTHLLGTDVVYKELCKWTFRLTREKRKLCMCCHCLIKLHSFIIDHCCSSTGSTGSHYPTRHSGIQLRVTERAQLHAILTLLFLFLFLFSLAFFLLSFFFFFFPGCLI